MGRLCTSDMDALTSTELGSLPSDWRVQRFDSLFAVQQGKQVSKKNRVGENQRPFLRTKNVFWGRLDLTNLDEMHFTETDEKRLVLQPDDLLVCEGGDIGRTAIWRGELARCYYQNHLHRARVRDEAANSEFALYWLWYAFEIGSVYFGRGNVTTIPNLSQSKLCELPLPVPPLPEQRKIAGVLGVVQRAIEQQERLLQLTAELKKTLLHQLFTQGLRGEPQKQTEIGTVPESWEVVRLDSMFRIQQGKQVSKKNRVGENQHPFLRTKNVFWGRLDLSDLDEMHFTEAEERRLTLEPGDLLVCEGGDIGRTAIWNGELSGCYYQNHLHRVRAINRENTEPAFLMYWLWYAFELGRLYFGRGNVTTIPNLSQSKLAELPIPNFQLDEQKEIVSALNALSTKETLHSRKRANLTDLFRTLLHQLMAAQIRVNDLELPELSEHMDEQ